MLWGFDQPKCVKKLPSHLGLNHLWYIIQLPDINVYIYIWIYGYT